MDPDKIVIRDGIFATYNENGYKRPIIICNVKRDSTGIYFNALYSMNILYSWEIDRLTFCNTKEIRNSNLFLIV